MYPEPAVRLWPRLQNAAEQRGSFAHSGQPVPGPGHGRGCALAVVGHGDFHVVVAIVQVNGCVSRAGVLEGIGQRLLHDPVRGQVQRVWQRYGLTRARQFDRQPGGADLVEEAVQRDEAGLRLLWRDLRLLRGRAEHAE